MKKCSNCNKDNRDTDIFCRNCGMKMHSNGYYITINVATVLSFLVFLVVAVLIATSWIIY